jgi:large subunit ribosomal protein L22
MTKLGYAYQGKIEDGIARAIARDVRISPKHSYEIANALRGMQTVKAKTYLEAVMGLKRAIPFKRYNRGGTGHRKKMGPGRYPEKAGKEFLKLLEEVEANAEFKGLNRENLIIEHLATHRGEVIQGRYKGGRHNTPTTHIEVVVKEQTTSAAPSSQIGADKTKNKPKLFEGAEKKPEKKEEKKEEKKVEKKEEKAPVKEEKKEEKKEDKK